MEDFRSDAALARIVQGHEVREKGMEERLLAQVFGIEANDSGCQGRCSRASFRAGTFHTR